MGRKPKMKMHSTTSALLLASGLAFAWASIPTTEWSEQPSARDEWNEQSEQLSWGTKAPTRWLTQDYVVAVTLSSKYNSDTTATIDIRLTNAAGVSTDWNSIGSAWGKEQKGKTTELTINMRDVGNPTKLELKSDGSNAVKFESIMVAHPDGDSVYFGTVDKDVSNSATETFDAADSSVEYEFVVTLSTKSHADTDAKIFASIKGAHGAQSGWMHMESEGFWSKDKMGVPVPLKLNLRDVGPPTQLLLKSNTNDAATFESITVAAPGMNATYFATSTQSIKCKSNSYFAQNHAECIDEFNVGVKPGEEGEIVCVEQSAATPLTSNFKKPANSEDLTYGSEKFNFTVRVDCAHRGAYRFEYHAQADCGKLERRSGFSLDPKVSKDCQQRNGQAYPTTEGVSFDRGHLVPANHMDSDKTAIYESNYMTNILPQAANMNRGAWLKSEEIIECLRVEESLYVLGGAVYDKNYDRYDWFKESHLVDNPSYFWKIIKSQDLHPETGNLLALWMPNSEDAVRAKINDYVVSIAELEQHLKDYDQEQSFDVSTAVKKIKPTEAWAVPSGCDKQL